MFVPCLSWAPRDRNLAMAFTCGKCDTRSVKTFSRHSYEHGIVLVSAVCQSWNEPCDTCSTCTCTCTVLDMCTMPPNALLCLRLSKNVVVVPNTKHTNVLYLIPYGVATLHQDQGPSWISHPMCHVLDASHHWNIYHGTIIPCLVAATAPPVPCASSPMHTRQVFVGYVHPQISSPTPPAHVYLCCWCATWCLCELWCVHW